MKQTFGSASNKSKVQECMKTLRDVVEEIHLGLSTTIHQNVRQIHDATCAIGAGMTEIRSHTQRIISGTGQNGDKIMVR